MAARGTTGFPREGRLSPRTQTDNYLCFVDLKQIKKQMFVILSEINPLSDESFLNLFEKNLLGSIRRHFPLVFGWFKSNFVPNEFFLNRLAMYFWVQKWHILRGKKVQKWNILRGEKGPKMNRWATCWYIFCQKWCMGSFCLRNRDFGTKTNGWEFREVWLTGLGSIHLYKIYHRRLFVVCS